MVQEGLVNPTSGSKVDFSAAALRAARRLHKRSGELMLPSGTLKQPRPPAAEKAAAKKAAEDEAAAQQAAVEQAVAEKAAAEKAAAEKAAAELSAAEKAAAVQAAAEREEGGHVEYSVGRHGRHLREAGAAGRCVV